MIELIDKEFVEEYQINPWKLEKMLFKKNK